jgi:hypothetical protein
MALLNELFMKLDQGYEREDCAVQERVSFQRDLVLWGINQPESELRDQLADASGRLQRCEEQRTLTLVEMIGVQQERDPKAYCGLQSMLESLEREHQNCLLALQARQFFLECGQTPQFEEFISAVV